MQISFPGGSNEKRAMTLAAGVVVLSAISIVVFIVVRGGILFYIFAALTVIAFLYMAYDLSRPRRPQAARRAAGARPRRRRAKAKSAKRKR